MVSNRTLDALRSHTCFALRPLAHRACRSSQKPRGREGGREGGREALALAAPPLAFGVVRLHAKPMPLAAPLTMPPPGVELGGSPCAAETLKPGYQPRYLHPCLTRSLDRPWAKFEPVLQRTQPVSLKKKKTVQSNALDAPRLTEPSRIVKLKKIGWLGMSVFCTRSVACADITQHVTVASCFRKWNTYIYIYIWAMYIHVHKQTSVPKYSIAHMFGNPSGCP